MFTVLWQAQTKYNRSVSRQRFADHYWSANRINFDAVRMPQQYDGDFDGTIAILEMTQDLQHPGVAGKIGEWWLAGVMDAFWAGLFFPNTMRAHKEVLAAGTMGPAFDAPYCDLNHYSPSLFVFSHHSDASVALGIDRLTERQGVIIIPSGKKILVTKT